MLGPNGTIAFTIIIAEIDNITVTIIDINLDLFDIAPHLFSFFRYRYDLKFADKCIVVIAYNSKEISLIIEVSLFDVRLAWRLIIDQFYPVLCLDQLAHLSCLLESSRLFWLS